MKTELSNGGVYETNLVVQDKIIYDNYMVKQVVRYLELGKSYEEISELMEIPKRMVPVLEKVQDDTNRIFELQEAGKTQQAIKLAINLSKNYISDKMLLVEFLLSQPRTKQYAINLAKANSIEKVEVVKILYGLGKTEEATKLGENDSGSKEFLANKNLEKKKLAEALKLSAGATNNSKQLERLAKRVYSKIKGVSFEKGEIYMDLVLNQKPDALEFQIMQVYLYHKYKKNMDVLENRIDSNQKNKDELTDSDKIIKEIISMAKDTKKISETGKYNEKEVAERELYNTIDSALENLFLHKGKNEIVEELKNKKKNRNIPMTKTELGFLARLSQINTLYAMNKQEAIIKLQQDTVERVVEKRKSEDNTTKEYKDEFIENAIINTILDTILKGKKSRLEIENLILSTIENTDKNNDKKQILKDIIKPNKENVFKRNLAVDTSIIGTNRIKKSSKKIVKNPRFKGRSVSAKDRG